MKRKSEQVIITAITVLCWGNVARSTKYLWLFSSSPTPFDASYVMLQADEIDKSFLCPCYSLNGYILYSTCV